MLKQNFVCSLCFLFCLVGCGGQPFDYQDANEMKPGPGILSGEDGEFNLIRSQDAALSPDKERSQADDEEGQ